MGKKYDNLLATFDKKKKALADIYERKDAPSNKDRANALKMLHTVIEALKEVIDNTSEHEHQLALAAVRLNKKKRGSLIFCGVCNATFMSHLRGGDINVALRGVAPHNSSKSGINPRLSALLSLLLTFSFMLASCQSKSSEQVIVEDQKTEEPSPLPDEDETTATETEEPVETAEPETEETAIPTDMIPIALIPESDSATTEEETQEEVETSTATKTIADWNPNNILDVSEEEMEKIIDKYREIYAKELELEDGDPNPIDTMITNYIVKLSLQGDLDGSTLQEIFANFDKKYRIIIAPAEETHGIWIWDKDKESVIFAEKVDGSQLHNNTAFGIDDYDDFELVSENNFWNGAIQSKDGKYITPASFDKDGNLTTYRDLVTGEKVEVPKIKEFPRVKEIENYADNPLTLEDFESGDHLEWLNSLLPEILEEVDWDKVKTGVPLGYSGDFLCYTKKNIPHWDNPEEIPPFIRDTDTFGLLTHPNGNRYISVPELELDVKNKTGIWIETFYALQNSYGPFSDEAIEKLIGFWESQKVTLIGRTPNLPGIPTGYAPEVDPFIATTFEKYPEMQEYFSEIFNGDPNDPNDHGDFRLLSGPGKYFLTNFAPDPSNRHQ